MKSKQIIDSLESNLDKKKANEWALVLSSMNIDYDIINFDKKYGIKLQPSSKEKA